MTASTLRASYSISAPVLQRFNALVPNGERSRVVEDFMKRALVEREGAMERLADAYLQDSAFVQCRDDEARWEVTHGDGLEAA